MSSKILLLEDDKLFNETLQDFLEGEGFLVDTVLDPYSALDCSYQKNYDLYLFDVNLPYEDGFELLSKLRSSGDETPTIFITSRRDKASLHTAFINGADDYIHKPVDLEELLLRIYALLRRLVRHNNLQIDIYSFNIMTKKLYLDNKVIPLSSKAGELLLVLLEGKNNIISTEYIKSRLWSAAQDSSDGAIRVYITQLKKYFPSKIKNIRGVGYQMITS